MAPVRSLHGRRAALHFSALLHLVTEAKFGGTSFMSWTMGAKADWAQRPVAAASPPPYELFCLDHITFYIKSWDALGMCATTGKMCRFGTCVLGAIIVVLDVS